MFAIAADKLSSANLKNSGSATDDVVIQKQKWKCSWKHRGNFRCCVIECRAVVLSGAQLVREKNRIKR